MATGMAAVRATAKGGPLLPSGLLFLNSYKTVTPTDAITNAAGTKTITGAAPTMVISLSGSGVVAAHGGSTARCSGYGNAGNNGDFTIVSSTTSAITITNPSGVPEVGPVGARVDVLGLCSSATDLITGAVFTQATTADKWAVNDSLIPGTKVLCTGLGSTMGRFMTVTDAAIAGQLNAVQPFSMFVYIYPVLFNAQTGITAWMTFDDGAAVSLASSRVSSGNASRSVTADGAGVLTDTNMNGAAYSLSAWQLWTMTNDGTTAANYVNGVLHGTAASAAKSRVALNRVILSNRAAGTTGLVSTRHFRAVEGAFARVITAAEQLQILAYCQSQYA